MGDQEENPPPSHLPPNFHKRTSRVDQMVQYVDQDGRGDSVIRDQTIIEHVIREAMFLANEDPLQLFVNGPVRLQ